MSTENIGTHSYCRLRVREDVSGKASWVADHLNCLLKIKRIRVRAQDFDFFFFFFLFSINGEMLGLPGFQ